MKLSLAVFRLHIASRLKKNKVLARHREGGGGIKCALDVCCIDVSMYLFWIYFDKGLLSALTSPKFSLPHVTFRTLNALNVQLTIISKPVNFTSPNESNTFTRKNSSLATTKHLGTNNNYFHFSRRLLYSHIFFCKQKTKLNLKSCTDQRYIICKKLLWHH